MSQLLRNLDRDVWVVTAPGGAPLVQAIQTQVWEERRRDTMYWAVRQLIGRYFSENIPRLVSFALALGSSADWLGHEANSKSKHMKALPITCRTDQYVRSISRIKFNVCHKNTPTARTEKN